MGVNFNVDLLEYALANIGEELIEHVDPVISAWAGLTPGYSEAYGLLADEASKRCFVAIIAARMFWHLKPIPLMNEVPFPSDDGAITNLSSRGYDIRLKIDAGSRYLTFDMEQYRYKSDTVDIVASPGDIVIDGGGYVGDSALYFAHRVGKTGKVLAFEFIPNNVTRLKENVQFNPHLEPQIELVEHPLWGKSGHELAFDDEGPASRVSNSTTAQKFLTASVDDIVERKSLPRIDFLKLDIEGSEVDALCGAEKTIRTYRPRLGVCLYHANEHFSEIPLMLKDMNPCYEFYVRHMTWGLGETVLYAIDRSPACKLIQSGHDVPPDFGPAGAGIFRG